MLLEDSCEVGLSHIAGKGTVAEDCGAFTRRGKLLVPFDDTKGQRLYLVSRVNFGPAAGLSIASASKKG